MMSVIAFSMVAIGSFEEARDVLAASQDLDPQTGQTYV